jgi:hypothetical protein
MNRAISNIFLFALAIIALTVPCHAIAQGASAMDTEHVSPVHYIVQAGVDLSGFYSADGPGPGTSLLVAENSSGHTFGASFGWVPSSDPDWATENFGTVTLRYYSRNTINRGAYGFLGLGGVARMRSGKSASDGQSFFTEGIPGTHEVTVRPCAEVGFGGSLSLSPKSFFGLLLVENINALHFFLAEQISLGLAF